MTGIWGLAISIFAGVAATQTGIWLVDTIKKLTQGS